MITLRQGRAEDEQAVQHLLAACEMAGALDPCECVLAVDGGCLAGLARVEHAGGNAYLRPIAVAFAYQGQGVGRRLIEALYAGTDEFRVVARGSAVGFYETLGFQRLDWEMVDPAFQTECVMCPERGKCNPIAMRSA